MITVSEAARQLGRNPETIRRWIPQGKLPARKIGGRHVIAEDDLDRFEAAVPTAVPPKWRETLTGEPTPDWVRQIHRSRMSH